MRLTYQVLIVGSVMLGLSGCHEAKAPRVATADDIESARQEAQREIAEARAEASKDVKSAAKVSGSNPAVIAEARVTAKYDVDMAKADGDHKIASEQCLALQADQQPACKERADAEYETAKATAKESRLVKRQ